MRDTLKVLFLAADPFKDGAPLQLGDELHAIDEAIQRGSARDRVELVSHFATQTSDLQYALLRHRPHVVHFAGHGGEGVIYLGGPDGRPRAVGRAALGELFEILKGDVRGVVLNGCHSVSMLEEISRAVDFAIGTSQRVIDQTAIRFAAAFYTALAFGSSARRSFQLAVNQLRVDGSDEAGVFVLRMRDGATDTPLVALPGPGVPGAGDIRQRARVGDVEHSELQVIGHKGQLSGARSVNQDVGMKSVRGSQVRIVGSEG